MDDHIPTWQDFYGRPGIHLGHAQMAGTTELDQRPVLAENDILVVRRGLNRGLIRGALVLKLAGPLEYLRRKGWNASRACVGPS